MLDGWAVTARLFSVYIVIDDGYGTVTPGIVLASEKLMVVIAAFAKYKRLSAAWTSGTLVDENDCFT